jgi:voltage-gated potassium channel
MIKSEPSDAINDGTVLDKILYAKHFAFTIILLSLLIIRPLSPNEALADAIFLPTIILAAWLAGGKSRRSFGLTVIFGAAAFGVLIFDFMAHNQISSIIRQPVGLLVAVAILFILLYCGGVVLHSLLTAKRVYVDEVVGTLNIYLLIGYTWSYIYVLLEICRPGSFRMSELGERLSTQLIYFSFITLTTVGFGDTSPATPVAQALVILEAIFGQYFVAVVVAYLVSMYITHKFNCDNNSE